MIQNASGARFLCAVGRSSHRASSIEPLSRRTWIASRAPCTSSTSPARRRIVTRDRPRRSIGQRAARWIASGVQAEPARRTGRNSSCGCAAPRSACDDDLRELLSLGRQGCLFADRMLAVAGVVQGRAEDLPRTLSGRSEESLTYSRSPGCSVGPTAVSRRTGTPFSGYALDTHPVVGDRADLGEGLAGRVKAVFINIEDRVEQARRRIRDQQFPAPAAGPRSDQPEKQQARRRPRARTGMLKSNISKLSLPQIGGDADDQQVRRRADRRRHAAYQGRQTHRYQHLGRRLSPQLQADRRRCTGMQHDDDRRVVQECTAARRR